MLLILTNSVDGTTDEIIRRLGKHPAFRFNVDLWRQYEFEFTPHGFFLRDPAGRTVREEDVSRLYVRKPNFDEPVDRPAGGSLEWWTQQQVSYLVREIYNLCKLHGKIALVEKGAENRLGKVSQMRLAARHFHVPPWRIVRQDCLDTSGTPQIAKSLVADFTGNYQFFFTRCVKPETLDPSYPWFLQDLIDAEADVTVVYVAGRQFAFELDRASFSGVDWRKHINAVNLVWKRVQLPDEVANGIGKFMSEAGLSFGRLDFLRAQNQHFFLEVNPNGQWAWLDMEGKEGIFDWVIECLASNDVGLKQE
ncbi:MAG: hypothetical protein JNM65_15725 [Verrucomicrobiaceae bacterium]|nr:hypothetical protein [Verrucomicrobiaceae bacterium]